tara:strand:+ start:2134 stop:2427 length:294 start_codon:yes stop_codon:yes gene_type:complete
MYTTRLIKTLSENIPETNQKQTKNTVVFDNEDAMEVFEKAIAKGVFTQTVGSVNDVGAYMYMHTEFGKNSIEHHFKHKDTRQYSVFLERGESEDDAF